MLTFFTRMFGNWGDHQIANKFCACGYVDLNKKDCPYCVRDKSDSRDYNESIGLNRSDINFYFAVLSACSLLGVPLVKNTTITDSQDIEKPTKQTPVLEVSDTSIGQSSNSLSVRESFHSNLDDNSATENGTHKNTIGVKKYPLDIAEPSSDGRSNANTGSSFFELNKHKQHHSLTPSCYGVNEPQEQYYVPKSGRVGRQSTMIFSRPPLPNKEKRPMTSSFQFMQPDDGSKLPLSETSHPVLKLQEVLEEYRMVVTNSVTVHPSLPLKHENDEDNIFSTSARDLRIDSQANNRESSECCLYRATRQHQFHYTDTYLGNNSYTYDGESTNRHCRIIASGIGNPSNQSTSTPSAVPSTWPTTMTISPSEVSEAKSARILEETGSSPNTGPSCMVRRLLSSSPGFEQELRERAADVWGTAIGFDDYCLESLERQNSQSRSSEIERPAAPPIEEYARRRDQLKSLIKELLAEAGLLQKFEKELTLVKKENSKFHQAQQVVPGLWVGSFYAASNRLRLYSLGITHIVCCANVQPPFTRDFHYIVLPCEDKNDQNISRFFARTNRFIKTALLEGGRVLVHCGAGVSRAPTICAAFLIGELNVTADLALQLVRAARPFADPNDGFKEQLRAFHSTTQRSLEPSRNFVGRISSECLEKNEREKTGGDFKFSKPTDFLVTTNVVPLKEEVETTQSDSCMQKRFKVNFAEKGRKPISTTWKQSQSGLYSSSQSQQLHQHKQYLRHFETSRSAPDFTYSATDSSKASHFAKWIWSAPVLSKPLKTGSFSLPVIFNPTELPSNIHKKESSSLASDEKEDMVNQGCPTSGFSFNRSQPLFYHGSTLSNVTT